MGRENVTINLPDKISVTHVIEGKSTTGLLLNGLVGAVNRLADQIGGGLRAIALAVSTPQDNSAQVQAEIDRYVQEINASSTKVEDAIKQQKGE